MVKLDALVTEKDGQTITLLKFNLQWVAVGQKDKQITTLKILNSHAIKEMFNLDVKKYV